MNYYDGTEPSGTVLNYLLFSQKFMTYPKQLKMLRCEKDYVAGAGPQIPQHSLNISGYFLHFLSKGFLVWIKWKQQGFFIFMYVTYFSYFVCVGLLPLFINVWQRMCNDIHVKHFCFSFHIFCDECRVGQHSSGIICFASHMNGPINLRFGNNKASIILS